MENYAQPYMQHEKKNTKIIKIYPYSIYYYEKLKVSYV